MKEILISPAGGQPLSEEVTIIILKLHSKYNIRAKEGGEFGRFLSRPQCGIMNHFYPLLQNTSLVIKLRLSCWFSVFVAWTMLEKHCQVFSYWAVLAVIQTVPLCSCITMWLSFCLLNINCISGLPLRDPGHLVWNWGAKQILWSHALIYSFRCLDIVCGFY